MNSKEEIQKLKEGCGREACGVQTISEFGEEDVSITECGVMCPYHKEVHYCPTCQAKLQTWKQALTSQLKELDE